MFRLRTFGSVGLADRDGRAVEAVLAQPKRLALLSFLAAARPRGAHRRDRLFALFWPDLDAARARDALNQALRFLRQALGADAVVSRGPEDVAIDPQHLWCDTVAFQAALDAGNPGEAMELYRGEFLQGFFVEEAGGFEEWMERERAAFQDSAARGARQLSEQLAAEGSLTLAMSWGRKALELAPDDERALRRLLRLHDRAGDRAGAFRAYEAFARRFEEEFGGEPSPETRALVDQLKAGRALEEERGASPRPAVASPRPGAGDLSGDIGDRYRILRKLGAGGMATVYLADDLKHDREVALKVLRPEVAEGLARERFVREIRIAGRLQHPNIVPLFDSGVAGDRLYYVMAHIEGETLRERLIRQGRFAIEEVRHLLREVAGALAYAHERGVIHRDIKPENILLIDQRAVLADFGIARAAHFARTPSDSFDATLTQPGTSLGTPAYMAPEQVAGSPTVDARADLYALGVLGYEMLAGHPPFTGQTAQEILAAQLAHVPVPVTELRPDTPPGLADLVMRCLEKQAEKRPESAPAFLNGLEASSTRPGVSPVMHRPTAERISAVRPWWKRQMVQRGAIAAGIMSIGVVMVLFVQKPPEPAPNVGASEVEITQIAVRPFVDLSSAQELGHIAEGLTADLISELARIPVLHVRSATAIAPLKRETPDSIRRALGIGTLIEGTVTGDRDSLRVSAAIVLARTGDELARQKWVTPRDRVLSLGDSLMAEVGRFIRDWLGSKIQTQQRRLATSSAQAWEHYQMGTAAYQEAGRLYKVGETVAAFKLAVVADSLLAQAQVSDPRWFDPVLARGWLAYWRAGSASSNAVDTAADWSRRAIVLAEQVLSQRGDHAEAHELRGTGYLYLTIIGRGDSTSLARAEADLRLGAVDANPSQARAWQSLARVLRMRGQPAEANVAAQRAYDLDPYMERAQRVLEDLCGTSFELNRTKDARRWCALGRQRFPAALVFPYYALEMLSISPPPEATPDSAWSLLRLLERNSPPAEVPSGRPGWQMLVAAALAKLGLVDSARHVLVAARSMGAGKPDLDVYDAAALTALGDQDAALDRLGAYLARLPMMRRVVEAHPSFGSLVANPRFRALVTEPKTDGRR